MKAGRAYVVDEAVSLASTHLEAASALLSLGVSDRDVAVAVRPPVVAGRITVRTGSIETALRVGRLRIERALADLTPWTVVGLSARNAERPQEAIWGVEDPLLGVTEVAELFDVSRQRASELRKRQGFPRPVADLAAGPVWSLSSLLRFEGTWKRSPGRPRRSTEAHPDQNQDAGSAGS